MVPDVGFVALNVVIFVFRSFGVEQLCLELEVGWDLFV